MFGMFPTAQRCGTFSFLASFRETIFSKHKNTFTFDFMNDTMTPYQAWKDFYEWYHGCEDWHRIGEDNRQYLRKTNRDVIAENCGAQRIKSALEKYALGRYQFQQPEMTVTKNEPE